MGDCTPGALEKTQFFFFYFFLPRNPEALYCCWRVVLQISGYLPRLACQPEHHPDRDFRFLPSGP